MKIADLSPLMESLVRCLERLTCLEFVDAPSTQAIKLLGYAAAASSSNGGAPWLTTPRSLALCDDSRREGQGRAPSRHGPEQALLRVLRLIGGGRWPRLQRLTVTSKSMSVVPGLFEAVVEAFESRGDECDRLQALALEYYGMAGWEASSVEQAGLLGRLLASPCCGELETLRIGSPHVTVPPRHLATLVSHLRSPCGRRLKSLACYWKTNASDMLRDPAMFIKALADGCLSALQTLEVSYLVPEWPVSAEAASALFRWAEGPFSQGLEVFRCQARTAMFKPLMEGVRAGHGLPVLKDIDFEFEEDRAATEGMIQELCLSMEAGGMPCLQSLHLQNMTGPGLVRLMESLSSGMSPCSATIQSLRVLGCGKSYVDDDEQGESVGRALVAGACPSLTSLDLSRSPCMGNRTARSIADALRGGAARQLKKLNLDGTRLGNEGCLALCDVMRECDTALIHVSFEHTKVAGVRGRHGVMEVFSYMPVKVVDGEVWFRYEAARRQDAAIRLKDMFD